MMRATPTCTACSMAATRCACSLSNLICPDCLPIVVMLRMLSYTHSAEHCNMINIMSNDVIVLRYSQAVHTQHPENARGQH